MEVFTDYDETDPNNHITVTSSKCETLNLDRNEDAYVNDDKGIDHFNGDFEFLFTIKTKTSGGQYGHVYVCGLSNEIDDASDWTHGIAVLIQTSTTYTIYVHSKDGGFSDYYGCADNTVLYCTLSRSGPTVTLKLYSDADRTELLATLTTTDSGSYRYLYGMVSNNSGNSGANYRITGVYIENLDLQEGGQTYEIFKDAAVQASAVKSLQTTFNIAKDAAVTSQAVEASETTFNIPKDVIVKSLADLGIETTFSISKDALVQALADVVVEKVAGQLIEIFKDAIVQAQASFTLESTFNINKDAISEAAATVSTETIFNVVKDAIVKASASPQVLGVYPINIDALVQASATPNLQQTLGINKDAVVVAVSTPLIQSTFNISKDAVVKVLAEVSVVKESEIKVTKLFLILGNIGIQLTGD